MHFRFEALALLLAPAVCLPAALDASAQGASVSGSETKIVYITRTDTPPVIDGVLNDAAWEKAAVVDDLHQVDPVEYAQPSARTVIYLTYDDNALYIAARLFEPRDEVTARVLRQGAGLFSDDSFSVILDPFHDRRSGYRFETNPNGLREDALYENVSNEEWDWDAIWNSAATINQKGWVAEMAIPFKSLSFDPSNDTWGINFRRSIAARNESMAWVSRNRATDPSTSGVAVGFEGLEQGLGLDVVTSIAGTDAHDFAAGSTDSKLSPSLDVFYKITPSLTGSLTFNTDFSATEVDDRQVNLSRFALFFPEKHDFFLQDSDIFEFGRLSRNGRPFFSRRIGLGPNGEIVGIDAGAKLTGRVGRWNIGFLSIGQEASAEADADTSTVARISANVLNESRVGFIATSGSPESNLDNSLVGFDFLYRNTRLPGGRLLEAQAWVQRSNTEGIEDNDNAFGFGVSIPNETGFRGQFNYRELDRNFNPGLGFVNRRNVSRIHAATHYTYRTDGGFLRSAAGGVEIERIELLSGGLQSQELEFELFNLDAQRGDSLRLEHTLKEEVLREPFEIHPGVVITAGKYDFADTRLNLRFANYRKVSGHLGLSDGSFYGGDRTEVSGGIDWRPSKHFSTDIDYTVNEIGLPQGSFTTRLISLDADIAFSSELSWVNRIQYDNVSDIIGVQSRLQWSPRAGQEAFFVLNHNLEDFDQDGQFASVFSEAAVKFNYTFRF